MKVLIISLLIFLNGCSERNKQNKRNSSITDSNFVTSNLKPNSTQSENNNDTVSRLQIIKEDTSFNKSKFLNQTFNVDPTQVYKSYFELMKSSLLNNELPLFLYDECLDYKNASYCYLNSHKSRSLRYDILTNLTKGEVLKTLKICDNVRLDRICQIDSTEGILYFKKSNLEILKSRLNN